MASSTQNSIILDIPARLQWLHGHGFCGETSVQSIGLFYGAWIPQNVVRTLNQGEFLLQNTNEENCDGPVETLKLLKFNIQQWDNGNQEEPQYEHFCLWMKKCLINRHPVIFCVYLPEGDDDDYDHIILATGIRYQNGNEFDPNDRLLYKTFLDLRTVERSMHQSDLCATRTSIVNRKHGQDGCIPMHFDYGIAVTGIIDEDNATVPVRLDVSSNNEPDPTKYAGSSQMNGTIQINNLHVGQAYALLRYSAYTHVPTRGDARAFLKSNFVSKHVFTATESTYIYNDPQPIETTQSVYYRCVPTV